jgi:translation initiation factor 2 subunit 2
MFKGLSKKKKSSKKSKSAEADDEEAPAADGEFDPSALKKKKSSKKSKAPKDFEAKLAEAGVDGDDTPQEAVEEIPEGDPIAGTGIWQHNATQVIPYALLASRFFSLIQSHHPDMLSGSSKSYKIPPPQCLREGSRKTMWANMSEICQRMKRSDEHVMQFLFAELGTSGSVDGSRRLVIKGTSPQSLLVS